MVSDDDLKILLHLEQDVGPNSFSDMARELLALRKENAKLRDAAKRLHHAAKNYNHTSDDICPGLCHLCDAVKKYEECELCR